MGEQGAHFQDDPDTIRWRMHFRSKPADVFQALASSDGRGRFWAESASEQDGMIHFVVPGGHESRGRILASEPDRCFAVEYFGWTVRFELMPSSSGGTDLEMTCRGVPDNERVEAISGWVSVLMAMKAAVDFGVELRNHDPDRTWWQGYADN